MLNRLKSLTPTDRLERLERKVGLPTDTDTSAADRAVLASRLAELEGPSEELTAALKEKRDAEEELAEAEERLARAKSRHSNAKGRAFALGSSRASRADRIRRQLLRTAPPCVRELREWKDAELAELRDSRPRFHHDDSRRAAGQPHGPLSHSDKPSRDRRYDYLINVQRNVVQEAAEIADPDECRAFCEEVRAGLPEIHLEPVGS